MTIAVGVLAQDGVVLATDTEKMMAEGNKPRLSSRRDAPSRPGPISQSTKACGNP